jgi:hypothetical protein
MIGGFADLVALSALMLWFAGEQARVCNIAVTAAATNTERTMFPFTIATSEYFYVERRFSYSALRVAEGIIPRSLGYWY